MTLQQFIEEACVQFSKEFQIKSTAGFDADEWFRAKLTECATLTAEAVKCEEDLAEYPQEEGFPKETQMEVDGWNAALTEIKTKTKAWFDTKI